MSVCAFLMIILFVSVYPANSPFWVVWLTLFVTLGMGAGIGYGTSRWARVGVLLLGAWIGGLIGGLLYSLVFYVFAQDNPLLALWLTIAFSSVIVAVISMIFFD
jgi:tryptophan-rich sensory protein